MLACPFFVLHYKKNLERKTYLERALAGRIAPVFIEEMDPRGWLMNSFMVNAYPSDRWNDCPAMMHGDANSLSFADGHAIIWTYADYRTRLLSNANQPTPNSPDLRQIQAWLGHAPYPPGVLQ